MEDRELLRCWMPERHSLLDACRVVMADGRVVYEGRDVEKAGQAFVLANMGGAKHVSYLVGGIEIAFSLAV